MKVAVQGAELFCATRGEGPTCLFLSGIGTGPYMRQTRELCDRLRVVYVDVRGSGRSTGDPTDLTFDRVAEDLEAVRAHLGVARIAVLGHSILGPHAIEYGRRCPESVSHVIAVAPARSWDMASLEARQASFFAADASEERKALLRENLAKLPADASLAQTTLAQTPMRFFDPRFDAAPLFAESEVRPRFLRHAMGAMLAGWDVTAEAASLRVPLWIALGRYDYLMPHVLWEGVAPLFPDAAVELFERSGHQPFVEEPERFADALTAWMASRP